MVNLEFYKNRKVLITGHTGFKGTWLCEILVQAGADVIGYALKPQTKPSLFSLIGMEKRIKSITGDIRDLDNMKRVFKEVQPEVVFHLAAQPLVGDSYKNPVYTYETNVLGTVNICECIRLNSCVKSFVNVTTDKVYHNNEWEWGYRETDALDGYDPYSNSKSCSELVTHSYINSFYNTQKVAASTVRAGNVIGGGDFANDRIIPDCARAAFMDENVIVRNKHSIRPYQHVLEPLFAYLIIAQKQFEMPQYSGFYNVGPDDCDCVTTEELVDLFCEKWPGSIAWEVTEKEGPHEANFLKLDCSRIKTVIGWNPKWSIDYALCKTVEWYYCYFKKQDLVECMHRQITEYAE